MSFTRTVSAFKDGFYYVWAEEGDRIEYPVINFFPNRAYEVGSPAKIDYGVDTQGIPYVFFGELGVEVPVDVRRRKIAEYRAHLGLDSEFQKKRIEELEEENVRLERRLNDRARELSLRTEEVNVNSAAYDRYEERMEKENAALREKAKLLEAQVEELKSTSPSNSLKARIEELEKDNAELFDENRKLQADIDDMNSASETDYEEMFSRMKDAEDKVHSLESRVAFKQKALRAANESIEKLTKAVKAREESIDRALGLFNRVCRDWKSLTGHCWDSTKSDNVNAVNACALVDDLQKVKKALSAANESIEKLTKERKDADWRITALRAANEKLAEDLQNKEATIQEWRVLYERYKEDWKKLTGDYWFSGDKENVNLAKERLEKERVSNTPQTAQKGKRSSLMKKACILLTVGALAGNVPMSDIYEGASSYLKGSDTIMTGSYEKRPACADCNTLFNANTDVALCGKCGSQNIGEKVVAPLYRDRGFPLTDKVVGQRFRNRDGTNTIVLSDNSVIPHEEQKAE